MFVVKMTHGWHDVVFKFESMFEAAGFMSVAMENFGPDEENELVFTVQKMEEETEDAEDVC